MTNKENALHVLKKDGLAEKFCIMEDAVYTVYPSLAQDRPNAKNSTCESEDSEAAMENRQEGTTEGLDWFGVKWIFDAPTCGHMADPNYPLLLDVDNLEDWRERITIPDLDSLDWEAAAKRDLEGYDRNEKLLRIFSESGPFERFHHLVGFENAFIAMYDDPDSYHEIMNALTEFKVKYFTLVGKYYKPDIILTMDDIGCAKGPLLSMDMYREFIEPYEQRVFDAIHNVGAYVTYHSCGNVEAFIPELIKMGADIIHPLQGGVNDQTSVEEEYGDQVVFDCCENTLVYLPESTEEELRAEMRRVAEIFKDKKNLYYEPISYIPRNKTIALDEARKISKEYYGS